MKSFVKAALPLILFVASAFGQTWISNVVITPSGTSAKVTYNTAIAAQSLIHYGVSAYTNATAVDAKTTSHTVTITGLKNGTTYLFYIAARDTDTQIANSKQYSFTTKLHTVALSWDDSDPTVVNYNVYRGACNGSYGFLSSTALKSFLDSLVANATTYCYVLTALNNAGDESPYSDPVTAVIP